MGGLSLPDAGLATRVPELGPGAIARNSLLSRATPSQCLPNEVYHSERQSK